MSDPQTIASSQVDEAVEDQPSHRRDHASGTHLSPSGTMGAAKFSPGVDSSAPPQQDTSNSSPGVFASAFHNATETIKQYLPSQHPSSSPEASPQSTKRERRRSSGGAIHKKAGSVKQSMPKSIASKLPGDTGPEDSPLPSKEIPGGSRVGVGSLPGHLSEVSVAKLPEERRQENLPSHETDHERLGKTGGVGPLPGGPNESGVALLPEERYHPVCETPPKSEKVKDDPRSVVATSPLTGEVHQEVLSSHESGQEQFGKTADESGVAVLPEERAVQGGATEEGIASGQLPTKMGPVPTSYDPPVQLGGQQHNGSPAVPPGSGEPDTASASKPLQKSQLEQVEKAEDDQKETDQAQDPGTHPISVGDESPPKENVQDTSNGDEFPSTIVTPDSRSGHSVPAAPQNSPVTATRKHRASTGSSPTHRVGFMDKMRGEAMIISGKLGKNEKKVEEGKILMGK